MGAVRKTVTQGVVMRAAVPVLLLLVAGCGKKSGVDPQGPADGVAVEPWGGGHVDRKAAEARLRELLPAGGEFGLDPAPYPDRVYFTATYSRPGFPPTNRVSFEVGREGDGTRVTVKGYTPLEPRGLSHLGEWEYLNGKLSREKALAATAEQWDWLQKRAGEVAAAAYGVKK